MKFSGDNVKSVLALMVIAFCFAYFMTTTLADIKPNDQIVIALVAFANVILGYYFGTTQGSAKKDETINELTKKQNE